jgi:hypothetical protein
MRNLGHNLATFATELILCIYGPGVFLFVVSSSAPDLPVSSGITKSFAWKPGMPGRPLENMAKALRKYGIYMVSVFWL